MKVRVPADVDMADRIFAGLTARQLAILGAHALLLWAAWSAVGRRVPAFVFGALAVPVATVGILWATAAPEGTTVERLVASAVRHFRRPRRLVQAPEGIPDAPAWAGSTSGLAPLDLPAGEPSLDGHIDLGSDGAVAVCRASAVNFALRSDAEQRGLVEGFGRFLNSLDAPVEFLVRSGRADLRALVERLEEQAGGLPHPALERAAKEHAAFLLALATRRDVLTREVLVCFREPGPSDEAAAHLDHRVEEASALLRGMGIRLARLSGAEATSLLARATDPEDAFPPRSVPAGVVEGR